MYITGLVAPGAAEPEAPFYWCNQTLRELGPDGEFVAASACADSGRPCYSTKA
jgi:hypothetical protein